MIEVGDNLLFLSPTEEPQLISALSPLNGGWNKWSDGMCSKNCGQTSIRYSIRSCTQPTPYNGGLNCVGESVQTEMCTGLPACTTSDCLAHEVLNPQTGSCDVNPNYVPSQSTGVVSGGSGTFTDGSGGGAVGGTGSGSGGGIGGSTGGVVSNPGDCPAGKIWDSRLYTCFTPYVLSSQDEGFSNQFNNNQPL